MNSGADAAGQSQSEIFRGGWSWQQELASREMLQCTMNSNSNHSLYYTHGFNVYHLINCNQKDWDC